MILIWGNRSNTTRGE